MNENETMTTLGALRYLQDRSAETLDAAAERMRTEESAARLGDYRDEHIRQAEELDGLMAGVGGKAPAPAGGFEEIGREHGRLVHEAGREDEALEAVLLMEELTAAQYAVAVSMELPPDIGSTLTRHLTEERRTISALQEHIGTLPVEVAGGGVSTDHLFVDDRNPDDFDAGSGMSRPH